MSNGHGTLNMGITGSNFSRATPPARETVNGQQPAPQTEKGKPTEKPKSSTSQSTSGRKTAVKSNISQITDRIAKMMTRLDEEDEDDYDEDDLIDDITDGLSYVMDITLIKNVEQLIDRYRTAKELENEFRHNSFEPTRNTTLMNDLKTIQERSLSEYEFDEDKFNLDTAQLRKRSFTSISADVTHKQKARLESLKQRIMIMAHNGQDYDSLEIERQELEEDIKRDTIIQRYSLSAGNSYNSPGFSKAAEDIVTLLRAHEMQGVESLVEQIIGANAVDLNKLEDAQKASKKRIKDLEEKIAISRRRKRA